MARLFGLSGPAALAAALAAGCSFAHGTAPTGSGVNDGAPGGGSDATGQPRDALVFHDAPPPPQVTFVQATSGVPSSWNSTSPNKITASFASAVAAGDTIVVYVTYDDRQNLSSITDSSNNTYTIVASLDDSSMQQAAAVGYAANVAAGTPTITAKLGGGACCSVVIAHELAGASTTAPFDVASAHKGSISGGTADNASTNTSGAIAGAGEYVFAATTDTDNTGGQAITAGTGETLREHPATGGNPVTSEDKLAPASGPVASTFTFAQSGESLSIEAVFKP
jgi:hypothetical protein